jgi:tRNA (guanine37-N1)-methyltransferase
MRIDILTLFPEMFQGFLLDSIIKRGIEKGLIEIYLHNIRDYSIQRHQQVDDSPFGGGAGMVLMIQPIADCINKLKQERAYDEVIYLSPDAPVLTQSVANRLSLSNNLILLAGRYKGIDQRIREYLVTKEISIGEYVLTGGELPAAVLTDCIVRLIPGVLHDESSALSDSFQSDLLDAPIYTKPADYNGWKVPEVLLSGNHKKIDAWRDEQATIKTENYQKNKK